MKPLSWVLPAAAAALLASCGSSPPTRFYELTAVAPAAGVQAVAGPPVRVAAVHLPDLLDRLQIVDGVDAGQVKIRSEDEWAAPLDDMSRRVLAEDLARRLPAGQVIFPKTPAPPQARALVVDVQAFGPAADGRAVLRAQWSLIGPGARPLLVRSESLSDPVPASGAPGEAAAMSRLLGRLADRIAAGIGAAHGT